MTTVPAGWAPIVAAPLAVGTTARAWAYYHVVGNAAAEPASYRWVLSARQKWSGLVTAFSGVDNATPFDTATSSAVRTTAGTTLAVPGVTTVTPGAMLIGGIGLSNPGTSATPPSGWTVVSDSLSTQRTVLADRLTTAAGASGTMTWTLSKSTIAGGWLTALRPAP